MLLAFRGISRLHTPIPYAIGQETEGNDGDMKRGIKRNEKLILVSFASQSTLAYEHLDHTTQHFWRCVMSHNCQPGVSAWAHPVVTNTGPLEYAVDQLIPGLCEALEARCQPEVLVMHPWEDDLVERSVMELC